MYNRNIMCIFSSFRCQSGVGFLHIKASRTFWYPSLEEVKAHDGPQSSLKLLGFNAIIILKTPQKQRKWSEQKWWWLYWFRSNWIDDNTSGDQRGRTPSTEIQDEVQAQDTSVSICTICCCLGQSELHEGWLRKTQLLKTNHEQVRLISTKCTLTGHKPTEGMFSGQMRPGWSKSHQLCVQMQI